MNILFYSPVNFRCRDLESLAKKYLDSGHQVYFLSQCKEGFMHHSLKSFGIKTFSNEASTKNIFVQLLLFIKFCNQHRINIVFSHLEPTNFISVIGQYFISANVLIFRHHINEARLYGFDKSFTYRVTYRLAKKIISVSEEGKLYMIYEEKIPERKVYHINLGYDFSLYDAPDFKEVNRIRALYKSELLLVSVGRLTKHKRHNISIEIVRQANLNGLNSSLLILGSGDQENELRDLVAKYSLEGKVFFLGYVHSIQNYLAASDFLIHPSILESSCVTVKEAGLVMLPAIVCKDVGDFNKYMRNEINGIVLNSNTFVEQALVHLKLFQEKPDYYKSMGKELKSEILSRFSIENTFNEYEKITSND